MKCKQGIKVLSLFDGMSCTQIALNRLGLDVDAYYASEVDKYAIQVTQANFPNTIQLGDVRSVSRVTINTPIDLIVAGSPCQDLSFAGKGKGLIEGERSNLFFEFVRILEEFQPRYFLLENVRMKQEYQDIISDMLGVLPTAINSSLVSAQSRNRLYWTNIPQLGLPKDEGIVLKDILEELPFEDIPNYLNNEWCGRRRGDLVKSIEDKKAHCLTASMYKGQIPTFVKKPIHVGDATNIKGYDAIKRVYHEDGKSPTLTTMQGGHREPKVAITGGAIRGRYKVNGVRQDHKHSVAGMTSQQLEIRLDEKTNCLTTVQKDNVAVDPTHWLYRKLTPLECERLQTVPDNYTNHVSKTQRYKMLGNGMTVDVLCHLMKELQV
jgi:DNA-cytosine methyltransferase